MYTHLHTRTEEAAHTTLILHPYVLRLALCRTVPRELYTHALQLIGCSRWYCFKTGRSVEVSLVLLMGCPRMRFS